MYAEKHDFLDMSTGIRQEVSNSVVIFKCSMSQLIKTFASVMTAPKCFQCLAKPDNQTQKNVSEDKAHSSLTSASSGIDYHSESTATSFSLKQCSKCGTVLYCSRACQIQHWNDNHKKLCSSMKYLKQLCELDFTRMNLTPENNCQFFSFV
jgi:hypothetical protein